MTVKELIDNLSVLPLDSVVVIPGYEWGVERVSLISLGGLVDNEMGDSYGGNHDFVDGLETECRDAVYLNYNGSHSFC